MKKTAAAILCGALLPAASAGAGCDRETNESMWQNAIAAVQKISGDNISARSLFESMGMEVNYDNGRVTAQSGDGRVSLYIGGNEMVINGESIRLDKAPFIRHGRTYISPEALRKALSGYMHGEAPGTSEKEEAEPTEKPAPTVRPTKAPAAAPTARPAAVPSARPTAAPAARPTSAPAASSEKDMEQQVLELVNKVRAGYGLGALTWAEDLAAVARSHSSDMIRRGFFDHTNPDGQSPFDRMKAAGISYRTAAENIAYGQRNAEEVMNAWMNSSGHRANILNAKVKEMGVGAVRNTNGTIYWTQLFAAR